MSAESPLRYEWVTDKERFVQLREAWNSMGSSAVKTIFLTHAWLQTWLEELAPHAELHALVAWDGERLIGALPLFADPRVGGGRDWQFMGAGTLTPNHLDIIAEPEHTLAVREAFVAMLLDAKAGWDTLVLDKLPGDTATAKALAEAFRRAGLSSSSVVSAICPYCELPATYDEYLASRKKRVRKKLRHALSVFAEQSEHARRSLEETEEGALAGLYALIALHQARWVDKGYPGAFADPAVVRFHRAIVRRTFAEGFLRMYTMVEGDQIIAVSYDFEVGGIVQAYLSSFDPRWSEWSPGIIMRLFAIEHSIAEGMQRFDFLEGVERYKSDWCNCQRENLRLVIYNRTLRGGAARLSDAAKTATVDLARKLLPSDFRERAVKILARRGAAEAADDSDD